MKKEGFTSLVGYLIDYDQREDVLMMDSLHLTIPEEFESHY